MIGKKNFRRLIACLLSTAILFGVPGTGAYQAAAQTMGRGAAAEGAVRPTGMPAAAPVSLGGSLVVAPVTGAALTAAPAALSATVSLPAAPIAAAPASLAAAAPAAAAAIGRVGTITGDSPVAAEAAPAALSTLRAAQDGTRSRTRTTTERAARPSDEQSVTEASRLFDGTISRTESTPVRVNSSSRRFGWMARTVGALVLAAGLALSPLHAGAQSAQPQGPTAAQTAAQPSQANAPPQQAVPAEQQQAPLPRPLIATISVDRAGATVGERVHLTVTLRNPTAAPITVQGLRQGLQDALPEDLELQGKGAEAPLTLAPGETKTVVYETIVWASGEIAIKDAIAQVAVDDVKAYPDGIEIVLPDSKVVVKSVLTPDWKQKGLRDIVDVVRAQTPNWVWVAGGALGFILLIGLERLLAARRFYKKLDARRLSIVVETEAELARLENGAATMGHDEFYAALQEAVTKFMVDFAGLPKRERSARVLAKDLKASKSYKKEQLEVAAEIAARAETARFSGAEEGKDGRLIQVARLRALVESVGQKQTEPAAKEKGGLNALMAAAGLQFGNPAALLLFIPFGFYLWKAWRARNSGERFAVSSAAHASSHRSWREKLAFMPRALRMSAVALLITAIAGPMIGVQRLESYTPSTDTMIVEDRSGSMDEKMGDMSKLDAAAQAIRAYVDEQRKGTQNRVGMETFDDQPYVDVRLTTDYDALISHLKEIKTGGSTAVGEAMLTAIGHFAEVNIMDMDGAKDARINTMQELLRRHGLAAALEYAKSQPGLMDQVLRPDRAKVIVLFTDGESNSGIDPIDAAKIAASLGVKIYTVGVGNSFDENTLRGISATTKGQFYKAGDAERMREVLLEISRLEKSPTKIVSSVSIKDYTALLALLAFMLLGAEAALANTRLRTLQALILAVGLQGVPLVHTFTPQQLAQVSAPAAPTSGPGHLKSVPPEMAEGNRLYAQGRYDEAVKKFAEALAAHPDVPELYFNMADAYLKMGDVPRALEAYQKYIESTPDAAKQSQALFNMGDAMLMRKDAEKAIEFYKEALRRDPNNQDAKWNLEALKQQQKEQQQQQQQNKKNQKGKKGQKGQKGQKGDQKGDQKSDQKGDQQGQPGDQKGDPQDASKDPKGDKQKGAEQLTSKIGDQQSKADENARKAITRKGSGVWGMLGLPLAGLAGHGIAFSSPWILAAALIGVPVAALLAWYGLRRNLKSARELSPGTAPKTARTWWGLRRYATKAVITLTALGLVGLAATDPRGGAVDQRVNFGGKDIIVEVDGSHSFVYAEDGRMDQAKKDLNQFIEHLQGTDRVGLVVFSGQARTASPISIDYANFQFKVNRLEVESRGLKEGSDLGAAVKFAAESFDNAKKIGDRPRILIVVSDGEAFDSEIDAAIAAAKAHGVTVYTIGIGTAAGTRMKVPTEDGKGTEYLIDSKTGQPAVSHLEEAKLRRLAEATGGAYFHADKGFTIDRVMESVAKLEQGKKGDTIKSPQPIGTFLLWPALALLLLDLLLPGSSLLRRDVPEKGGKRGKSGLLGAAPLIPMAVWPQLLPFALIGLALSSLIAYDVWTQGRLTRGLREAWQRRTRFIAKGVRSDLNALYDLRDADEPRLTAFIERWQAADDKTRPELIRVAAADEALWREKLTAAYLSGAGAEVHESVLTALRRTSRARLESLKPVVGRIEARRGALGWLDHSDAQARLASLQAAADDQPFAAPLPPAPKPAKRDFLARWSRALALALVIVTAGSSTLSIDGTVRYAREQAAAEQVAFKIFYGEDLYVFSDRYIDERIPQLVLPALRDWHKSVRDAGPEFERAMQILRESPDPKADNLLVTAFRHAALLPMDSAAETTLLKALIERDSDALWAAMDRTIAQSGDDAKQAALLGKLVVLGAEVGNENAIANLFRVLKSPNEQVRGLAFETLYNALTQSDKPFFPRLTAIDSKFASDPNLQLWSAVFGLRRLSAPDAAALPEKDVRAFFDQVVKNASAVDAQRLPLFAQALAAAQQSGQDPELPPAMMPMLIGIMAQFEAQAQGQDGAAPVPAPLAGLVRYEINQSVTALIKEAEAKLPGLHEQLVKDGVVLPDTQETSGGGDSYEEYYGYHGYPGSYGRTTTTTESHYRELYKLGHLRALAADLDAASKAAQKAAGDDAKALITAAELGDRGGSLLKSALEGGARAGMMEGGTEPEKVADEFQPLLREGVRVFNASDFLTLLRSKALAPAVGDPSSALAYPETLDAAQLQLLRETFAAMAKDGKLAGGRDLTWAEKLYVAKALDQAAAAQKAHYPGSKPAAEASGFERPGEDGVALARLWLSIEADKKDGDALLRHEKELLARLSGPAAATATADDLKFVVPNLLKALDEAGRGAEGRALLTKAVHARKLPAPALEALRPQTFDALRELASRLEIAFPAQAAKTMMLQADLRFTDSEWRTEFKLRHYDALLKIARDLRASSTLFNPEQAKILAQVQKEVPVLKALAVELGVPAGDAPGEFETVTLNKALHAGWVKFPGQTFVEALRKQGLAAPGTSYDKAKSWFDSYSPADAKRLRDALQAMLTNGQWDTGSGIRPLTDDEKDLIKAAISAADKLIAAQAKAPAKSGLHGLAPLGLLLATGSIGSWLFAAAAAALACWLIWKYAFRPAPAAIAPTDEARRQAVDARKSRIAFAAERLANSVVNGAFRSRFLGAGGSDFAESRPYENDDYREIDWKTSAKKGEIYTKKFELERDMPLILLVDVSRSGRFGTRGAHKREIIEDVAATLALAAARTNVRVGAILFSDRVEAVIPVRGGPRHAAGLVDALMSTDPRGKGTDLKPALEQALGMAKSRAMIAIVSDFLAPDFKEPLSAIAARHDLRAIRVVDPAETKPLPDVALLPLVDAESGATRTLDTGDRRVRGDAAQAIARREAMIADDLLAARARPIILSTEGDPLETLAGHFDPKRRNAAPQETTP